MHRLLTDTARQSSEVRRHRSLFSSVIWFSLSFLVLMSISFGVISHLFGNDVQFDKPKFLEESAKVLTAYFLSLLSLTASQMIEHRRLQRRAEALHKLIHSSFSPTKENLERFVAARFRSFDDVTIEEFKEVNLSQEELVNCATAIMQTTIESINISRTYGVEEAVLCIDQTTVLQGLKFAITNFINSPQRTTFESAQNSAVKALNDVILKIV